MDHRDMSDDLLLQQLAAYEQFLAGNTGDNASRLAMWLKYGSVMAELDRRSRP